jgi:hypothetical protein
VCEESPRRAPSASVSSWTAVGPGPPCPQGWPQERRRPVRDQPGMADGWRMTLRGGGRQHGRQRPLSWRGGDPPWIPSWKPSSPCSPRPTRTTRPPPARGWPPPPPPRPPTPPPWPSPTTPCPPTPIRFPPLTQPQAGRLAGALVGAALHRHAWMTGDQLAATWRHDLGSQASLSAAISQRQHPDLTTTLHRALAD